MKVYFAATAALSSIASAFPLSLLSASVPPPANAQFYQLQAKSATTAVNNRWVGIKVGETSYSLATTQAAASKFFVRLWQPTGTYLMFNGDDTRQVALRGPSGVLLYVVDVQSPNAGTIPGGQLMEWGTFTMDNNVLGVKDGSTLTNRTFVAVQGTGSDYGLAFYDGVSNTTESISPVTLNWVNV